MHILSPGDTIENANFETWVTFKNVITYYKVMMFSIEGVYKIKQNVFLKKKKRNTKKTNRGSGLTRAYGVGVRNSQ